MNVLVNTKFKEVNV